MYKVNARFCANNACWRRTVGFSSSANLHIFFSEWWYWDANDITCFWCWRQYQKQERRKSCGQYFECKSKVWQLYDILIFISRFKVNLYTYYVLTAFCPLLKILFRKKWSTSNNFKQFYHYINNIVLSCFVFS